MKIRVIVYTDLTEDVSHFGPNASKFDPSRFIDAAGNEIPYQGIQHFSFGAGSRACSGQLIASRLLYAALIRILTSYKIVASETEPPNTDYVEYNQFKTALVAIPRDFKVRLVPRDGEMNEACLAEAEERTKFAYTTKA